MPSERSVRRYRSWYARLLRLHTRRYYERFGEEMEQTFADLLRERAEAGRGLLGCALWMFVETSVEIIKEDMSVLTMKNITGIALAVALTFVAIGVLGEGDPLFGIGLLSLPVIGVLMGYVAYTEAKPYSTPYGLAIGIALVAAFLLIWMSLGVGIIGRDGDPVNVVYFGVFAVGIIGAAVARFEPRGMARTLFATALAQVSVAVVAVIAGLGLPWSPPAEIAGINGFFVALFVGSGLLFRRARRKGLEAEPAV